MDKRKDRLRQIVQDTSTDVVVDVDIDIGFEADFKDHDFISIESIDELSIRDLLVNLPRCEVHEVTGIDVAKLTVQLDDRLAADFEMIQRHLKRAVERDP